MLETSIHTKHGRMQMKKMTVKNYIFTKYHAYRKMPKYKLYRNGKRCKKVPDLNCGVQDLLLEVVDLK